MATWKRMIIFAAVTIAVAVAGIIHFRVGVAHLYPMAQGQFKGPMTPAVNTLETMVPIILAIIELGVALWAISGGVQRERSRMRGGRR